MKINTSVALKAGLIGAVAGLVFALLIQFVPFFVCIGWWIGPLLALVAGVLYVYLSSGKVDIGEGAIGGAIAGAITGAAQALISALLAMLFSDAGFGGLVLGLLTGAFGGAVGGAIGGAVYSLIKK
jgi:hypothetical protein